MKNEMQNKMTKQQITSVTGIKFVDALVHPAYSHRKVIKHENDDGSSVVEEAAFFSVSDVEAGYMWVASRYFNIPRC